MIEKEVLNAATARFHAAVVNEHFGTARTLLHNKEVNVFAKDHFAFRHAVMHGQVAFAESMANAFPDKYVVAVYEGFMLTSGGYSTITD